MLNKIVLIGVVPLFLLGAMSFGTRSTTSDPIGPAWGRERGYGRSGSTGGRWSQGSGRSSCSIGGGCGKAGCSSCKRYEPYVPPKPQTVCQPTCQKRPPPCPEPKCETVECCKVRPQRKIKSDCCRGCNRVVYQQLDCCRRCPPRMKYSCRPCKGEPEPCPEIIPCKMCPQTKPCGKVSPCQCNTRPQPACNTCKDKCSLCE